MINIVKPHTCRLAGNTDSSTKHVHKQTTSPSFKEVSITIAFTRYLLIVTMLLRWHKNEATTKQDEFLRRTRREQSWITSMDYCLRYHHPILLIHHFFNLKRNIHSTEMILDNKNYFYIYENCPEIKYLYFVYISIIFKQNTILTGKSLYSSTKKISGSMKRLLFNNFSYV